MKLLLNTMKGILFSAILAAVVGSIFLLYIELNNFFGDSMIFNIITVVIIMGMAIGLILNSTDMKEEEQKNSH